MFSFLEYPYIDVITDWLSTFVLHGSVVMPMLLLFLEESGIPMPVPGDILVAYTGYQVSRGNVPYIVAFLGLLLAVMMGSSILYFLSVKYGQVLVFKIGKYIHVDEEKIVAVEKIFKRYGPLVIIFGRHIPGFRVPITIFSGMSDVSYKTFIISTFLSVLLWIPLYLSVGEHLGPRTVRLLHSHHIVFVTFLIFFALVGIYILYSKITSFILNKQRSHLTEDHHNSTIKGN